DQKRADELQREADQAARLGFDATFRESVPFLDRPGIELADQARFHPREYLAGVVQVVDGGGSHVFEHTNAEEVKDSPLSVTANGHTIAASYIVVATHNPIVGKTGLIRATTFQTKLSLYTSYVIGGRVAPNLIPDALFWDTGDPYFYLRLEKHRG